MNYYYITGTSRGIGKAFAEHLLENPSNYVIGMSRQCSIEHRNYRHFYLDLTNVNAVSDFKFELHHDARKLYLINNAGSLGFIKPVGKLESSVIIRNYTLNLIAPSLLSNSFIQCYSTFAAEKVIVNISSGAARTPIDGWSLYCSSKAGLDMFSRVVDAEQKINSANNPQDADKLFRIFSIAPGVVDTAMQEEIRNSTISDFSRLEDFIGYHSNQQLSNPKIISEKYFRLLSKINAINEVSVSIKDYD